MNRWHEYWLAFTTDLSVKSCFKGVAYTSHLESVWRTIMIHEMQYIRSSSTECFRLCLSLMADIQTHMNWTQVWVKAVKIFFYIASHKRPLSLHPTWFRIEYQKSNDGPVVPVPSVIWETNWLDAYTYLMLRRYIVAWKRKPLEVRSNK